MQSRGACGAFCCFTVQYLYHGVMLPVGMLLKTPVWFMAVLSSAIILLLLMFKELISLTPHHQATLFTPVGPFIVSGDQVYHRCIMELVLHLAMQSEVKRVQKRICHISLGSTDIEFRRTHHPLTVCGRPVGRSN